MRNWFSFCLHLCCHLKKSAIVHHENTISHTCVTADHEVTEDVKGKAGSFADMFLPGRSSIFLCVIKPPTTPLPLILC